MFFLPIQDVIPAVLVFIRISGIFFALPIYGDNPVPVQIRVLLSLAVAIIIFPMVQARSPIEMPKELITLCLFVVKELAIGLVIGLIARILFAGIVMGASIVSYQMGFGTASLMMPGADSQMDAFTAFHQAFIIVIFFSLNLHHIFFRGIFSSFDYIGVSTASIHPDMGPYFISLTANMFEVALQLAAPLLIALLFTMAALGLVARAVPQMNVFTMSFPASFFIGLCIYIATLTMYPTWLTDHFNLGEVSILNGIKGLSITR